MCILILFVLLLNIKIAGSNISFNTRIYQENIKNCESKINSTELNKNTMPHWENPQELHQWLDMFDTNLIQVFHQIMFYVYV